MLTREMAGRRRMTGRIAPLKTTSRADPILRRLTALATLSDVEQALILGLSAHSERHRAGDELLVEGDFARRPRFVVSGWASTQRILSDGRRQVFGFALPGDGIGVYPRMAPPAPFTVVATTAMETVDAEPFLEAVRLGDSPGLLKAFSAAARVEDQILLDHIVRLGRQTAYERVAHFLLELHDRLAVVGLAEQQRFPLPFTQEILADTLGLSIVHINRTLQQMRRDHLIEWRSGMATILRRDLLASMSDYRLSGASRGAPG
jgi:CRP-like cAMP-binding protein